MMTSRLLEACGKSNASIKQTACDVGVTFSSKHVARIPAASSKWEGDIVSLSTVLADFRQ
ncbi:hypothetical protein [Paraburkholderia sp. GAS334]|uniref:hypothetical protein n=1 Tax=Paraburkholderia sp. GAS334 TaxID=3035131 RepID=UPI003D1A6456